MREDIADNLIETLEGLTSPVVAHVTRQSFDPSELSNAQFPAIMVTTSGEELIIESYGDVLETIRINYALEVYVKGDKLDTLRNEIIDAVRDKLYQDRHRGGFAIDTKINSVEIDDGSIAPIGGVLLNVAVTYNYGA